MTKNAKCINYYMSENLQFSKILTVRYSFYSVQTFISNLFNSNQNFNLI